MNVVLMSMWMNDADRYIEERIRHLLGKTYPHLRWSWVVGDSTDQTEAILRFYAAQDERIQVFRHDTGIEANNPQQRIWRGNETFNFALSQVQSDDDWIVWCESDLASPDDLAERLLAIPHPVVGGWPVLNLPHGETVFYDTWGYRAQGTKFDNRAPYHPVYQPDQPFEVDTVGSCLKFPAQPIRDGVRSPELGVVDLCHQLRARGLSVWVDPTLIIRQPTSLWTSREHYK